MFEFTADHFRELCETEPVRTEIATLDERRRRFVRRFWRMLAGTLLVLVAVVALAIVAKAPIWGFIFFVLVFGLGLGSALQPLSDTRDDFGTAVVETVARIGGIEYVSSDFVPPVLEAARASLFGDFSDCAFGGLFHGKDAQGKRFATYQASLTRGAPRNRFTVFAGQIYAWQRDAKREGETAILPDKGLLNLFVAPVGMDRVKFHDADADFEWEFQVYSTAPASARAQIGSALRRRLLDLRRNGKVFAYLGPEDVLIAAPGEATGLGSASMFSGSAEKRAKLMFDHIGATMAMLRQLKSAVDQDEDSSSSAEAAAVPAPPPAEPTNDGN